MARDPAPIEPISLHAEEAGRRVPGYLPLHRMASLLLGERCAPDARVLVLGAGGGMELRLFAQMYQQWCFDAVDPSADMLRRAMTAVGSMASRVQFHEGHVDIAPDGPFDGATCLLTLHYLGQDERRETVAQVHRRLSRGAPFVAAHLTFPNGELEKQTWLARYAAFAVASGVPAPQVERAVKNIELNLPVLSPEQDEAILREAGFADIALFYAGFGFRGWVCHRR